MPAKARRGTRTYDSLPIYNIADKKQTNQQTKTWDLIQVPTHVTSKGVWCEIRIEIQYNRMNELGTDTPRSNTVHAQTLVFLHDAHIKHCSAYRLSLLKVLIATCVYVVGVHMCVHA